MNQLIIVVVVLLLTGCGWFDRISSSVTGSASKVCIEGVEYLQFTSGASVAYAPDGKVKTCI